ncbi:pseudouridine synthase [Fimicolochytrium jonesii]|uniref:pseudouridine synthase n=1 Tax=Fimicolochytrium jonesii TaxID=1396493 RepID=UPI0022FEBB20|nr:pseudouridine synthase [Fimicolochytrium jonesii]KAI8816807.1 pseudouridine synthase [Fimicolochytrium jonesii]
MRSLRACILVCPVCPSKKASFATLTPSLHFCGLCLDDLHSTMFVKGLSLCGSEAIACFGRLPVNSGTASICGFRVRTKYTRAAKPSTSSSPGARRQVSVDTSRQLRPELKKPTSMSKSTALRLTKAVGIGSSGGTKGRSNSKAQPTSSSTSTTPSDLAEPTLNSKYLPVSFEEHLTRLDAFLENRLGIRRNVARLKILNGEVSVQGSTHARFVDIKPQGIVHAGDVVVVVMGRKKKAPEDMTAEEKQSVEDAIEAEIQKLRACVLYRDNDVLLINKPAGLAVQGGSKTSMHIEKLLGGLQFDAAEPPRLVHRLDRDTTGVLLLARTRECAARISKLFRDRHESVTKFYQAVVVLPVPKDEYGDVRQAGWDSGKSPIPEEGRITTGIASVGKNGQERMTIVEWYKQDEEQDDPEIKKAVTDYRVLVSGKKASLLELRPLTGRKHQLRVHCAEHLNAPVLGDPKYGKGAIHRLQGDWVQRKHVPLHLHMHTIVLKDWYGPHADLKVTAPLPPYMQNSIQQLGLRQSKP